MIDQLLDLFQNLVTENSQVSNNSEDLTLAATALMMEVARSDQISMEIELEEIEAILTKTLKVNSQRVSELLSTVSETVEEAHDLYQFTKVINDACNYQQKKRLVSAMWQVAFADGRIEAIEDHIIKRLASLLHVSHSDFIQLKIQVRTSLH